MQAVQDLVPSVPGIDLGNVVIDPGAMMTWLVCITIGVIIGYYYFQWDFRRKSPEAMTMMQAKRRKMPVLRVFWGGGIRESLELLEKSDSGFFFMKRPKFGGRPIPYKINGQKLQKAPTISESGVEIYNYAMEAVLPLSANSALAVTCALDYFRDPKNNFPVLSKLRDPQILQLVQAHDDWLADNLLSFMDIPKTASIEEQKRLALERFKVFYDEIIRDRKALESLPIEPRGFAFGDVIKAIDTTILTQDVQALLSEMQQLVEDEEKHKQAMQLLIIGAIGIIVAGGVSVFIVIKALGG